MKVRETQHGRRYHVDDPRFQPDDHGAWARCGIYATGAAVEVSDDNDFICKVCSRALAAGESEAKG